MMCEAAVGLAGRCNRRLSQRLDEGHKGLTKGNTGLVMKINRFQPLLLLFRLVLAVTVFAVFSCFLSEAIACPNCKEGLAEGDAASQAMAKGYFYSILFMMAMPFVLIGSFGSAAYFSIRRARNLPPSERP